jgi:hypothetical protein
MSELRHILEKHRKRLLEIRGVEGVAIGRSRTDSKKLCIVAYTTTAKRPKGLPETLEGYEIEIHKTTGFRARPRTASTKRRTGGKEGGK